MALYVSESNNKWQRKRHFKCSSQIEMFYLSFELRWRVSERKRYFIEREELLLF